MTNAKPSLQSPKYKQAHKEIEAIGDFAKWNERHQNFELSEALGSVYLRSSKDAELAAKLWNPQKRSIKKLFVTPVKLFTTNSKPISFYTNLVPVKFYEGTTFVGRLYTGNYQTGRACCALWQKVKNQRAYVEVL